MIAFTAAAKSAIEAAGVQRAYLLGAVPDRPTFPYLVLSVARDLPFGRTLDGAAGPVQMRVTTQTFGRTLSSAQDLDERAFGVLDGTPALTVAGWTVSPGRQQVGGVAVRDPDDAGVIGITSTYLIPATKETP